MAEIPVSVTVSRADGSARIQWAEGSDADLLRMVRLLIRAGDMVLAYERREGRNGAPTNEVNACVGRSVASDGLAPVMADKKGRAQRQLQPGTGEKIREDYNTKERD